MNRRQSELSGVSGGWSRRVERPPRRGLRSLQGIADAPLLLLVPAAVYLILLNTYPLVTVIRMSVSHVGPSNILGRWAWNGVGNFRDLLSTGTFWHALLTSVVYTVAILVVNISLGTIVALIMNKESRLVDVAITIMMFTWALPPVVNGSIWVLLLQNNGLIDATLTALHLPSVTWLADPSIALWSVVAVTVWASLPFAVAVLRSALKGISPELLEAAEVDGAGPSRINWHINLPLIRPTVIILALLTAVAGFRSFDYVYVMTGGGPGNATTTLPFLQYQQAFQLFRFGAGAATAVLGGLITIALSVAYLLTARYQEGARS